MIWLVCEAINCNGASPGPVVKFNPGQLETSSAFQGDVHDHDANHKYKCAITTPRACAINTNLAGEFHSHVVPPGLQHAGDGDILRPVPQAGRSVGVNREKGSQMYAGVNAPPATSGKMALLKKPEQR